jgi:hypothetical protein
VSAAVEVAGGGLDEPTPAVGSVSASDSDTINPAHRGSPLGSLRKRREALQAEMYLDLKVPRWDDDGGPAIYVRCKTMSPAFMSASVDKRKKPSRMGKRDQDWVVLANADVLVNSCIGVYAIEDGTPPSQASREQMLSLRDGDPQGEWTTFDPDLAFSLGLDGENPSAVRVVRALFFTDGDLLNAINRLATFSGLSNPTADEDFSEG